MSHQEERDAWGLDENGCAPDCPIRILGEQSGERGNNYRPNQTVHRRQNQTKNVYGEYYEDTWVQGERGYGDTGTAARYFAQFYPDSLGDLDENGCAPDCPIRILGEQSGVRAKGAWPKKAGSAMGYHGNASGYEIPERIESSEGTAARYFAQFYPDSAQERETTMHPSQSPENALPINQVLHGDCLDVLKTLEDNSVDSICTDPPAGIAFMGKSWDEHKGGRDIWVAWLTAIMREAMRVLKPGGHAFVWALPRTSHWTALALEDAGFEIRDSVAHMFGCLSEDTEILTANGWEQYATLKEGMRVLCYSPDTHTLVWDEIQDVVAYDYDETAYHLHSDDTDQIVSRNHRCIVGSSSPYSFEFSEELPSEIDIPFIANPDGLTEPDISQPGWYFASTVVQVTPVHYQGVVWCVRVPSGAFVARRNGKVFITGNSGFPKSMDVSKAIDRMAGKEREVIGINRSGKTALGRATEEANGYRAKGCIDGEWNITAPATPEAAQWQGWHSALKPSHEVWWLCRKPLTEHSIAAQVLATGTGALNIDISRVGSSSDKLVRPAISRDDNQVYGKGLGVGTQVETGKRFPANTLFSHSVFCVPLGEKRVRVNDKAHDRHNGARIDRTVYGDYNANVTTGYADDEGCETVQVWQCVEECPVRVLDAQSGVRKSGAVSPEHGQRMYSTGIYGDNRPGGKIPREASEGTASRYFQCFPPEDMPPFLYTSKASRRERSEGCEELPETASGHRGNFVCMQCGHQKQSASPCTCDNPKWEEKPLSPQTNHHPTVKPVSLLKYLITMITPSNGVVLDMFAGSGSTGVACVQSGFRYILIEKEQEYVDIIHARLAHAHKAMPVQDAGEYECVPECPVRILGEQSGERKTGKPTQGVSASTVNAYGSYKKRSLVGGGDTGKADRFFKVFPPDSLFAGMDLDEEAQG